MSLYFLGYLVVLLDLELLYFLGYLEVQLDLVCLLDLGHLCFLDYLVGRLGLGHLLDLEFRLDLEHLDYLGYPVVLLDLERLVVLVRLCYPETLEVLVGLVSQHYHQVPVLQSVLENLWFLYHQFLQKLQQLLHLVRKDLSLMNQQLIYQFYDMMLHQSVLILCLI